ncbi:MAG: N-acetyltransferase [Hyphomicrobiales bacterium]
MAGFAPDVAIRPEVDSDADAIGALTSRAFAPVPHADGSEAEIIARLRRAEDLHLSLVADAGTGPVGHVAFSPAICDADGWFALGPVSVDPPRQRQGIGSALIRSGLDRLRAEKAAGCILLGSPDYYARFGFRPAPAHCQEGLPDAYFMALPLGGPMPSGRFRFHPAFFGPVPEVD